MSKALVVSGSAAVGKSSHVDVLKDVIIPLVTQFLGVLIAAVLAFRIARWQVRKEQGVEDVRNQKLLKVVIKEVAIEVRDNRNRLKKLDSVLASKNLKDMVTWGYAHAITKGLKTSSYELLLSNGLAPYTDTGDMEVLYECYSTQDGVIALLREVHALSQYNLAEDEWKEVERLGKNVVTYNRTAISQFESKITKDFINKYLRS